MGNTTLPRSIYEPAGPAGEYAPLACNLYGDAEGKIGGCAHRCAYCYCPQMLHVSKERFFCSPKPRPRIIESLDRAAKKMVAAGDHRRVCFGFVGDVYSPMPAADDVTRQALQVMVDNGLPFEVCTKGGKRAERDFDLLWAGDAQFGSSMVWWNEQYAQELEPNAAPLMERYQAIARACERGIPAWVSIEPVLDPAEALSVISALRIFDVELRIGKINNRTIHQLPPHWQERVRQIDWDAFVREAYGRLEQNHQRFMFKDSLQPYLGEHQPERVGC